MDMQEILRSVFEIRYQAAGYFFDNRGKIADRWYQDKTFDKWNIHPTSVSFHNTDERFNFSVTHNRMAFDADFMEINNFCKQVDNIASWTTKTIKVRKINRIGFRLYFIFKRGSFENVYNSMIRQIYKLEGEDWDVFGGKPLDIGFPLTLKCGENTANFKMGPMKKEQIISSFNYEDEFVIEKIPDATFFIDFDLYKNDPDISLHSKTKIFDEFLHKSKKQILKTINLVMEKYEGFEK